MLITLNYIYAHYISFTCDKNNNFETNFEFSKYIYFYNFKFTSVF
jgi:hypothetical protein